MGIHIPAVCIHIVSVLQVDLFQYLSSSATFDVQFLSCLIVVLLL
jgi:hypothetical protein